GVRARYLGWGAVRVRAENQAALAAGAARCAVRCGLRSRGQLDLVLQRTRLGLLTRFTTLLNRVVGLMLLLATRCSRVSGRSIGLLAGGLDSLAEAGQVLVGYVAQERAAPILVREQRGPQRPGDADVGIIVAHTTVALWMIGIVAHVV